MTERELKIRLNESTHEQLVNYAIKLLYKNRDLNLSIKRMEEQYMQDVKDYKEQVTKTSKINEYWNRKERPLRKVDFDNKEVIERYKNGESAYRIAKDLNQGEMTIISRLKRAGVYEGKSHNKEGNK